MAMRSTRARRVNNAHTLLGVGLRTVWIVCILLVVDIKKYPYHIHGGWQLGWLFLWVSMELKDMRLDFLWISSIPNDFR